MALIPAGLHALRYSVSMNRIYIHIYIHTCSERRHRCYRALCALQTGGGNASNEITCIVLHKKNGRDYCVSLSDVDLSMLVGASDDRHCYYLHVHIL